MPYLNMDDAYFDHPKVEALSDPAYRLHGACMFYVARFRLDGYLRAGQLRGRRGWSVKSEAELVAEQLLHAPGEACSSPKCPADDGERYRLHDFFQWNKSKAWWDAEREKAAQRKAKWKASQDPEPPPPEHPWG